MYHGFHKNIKQHNHFLIFHHAVCYYCICDFNNAALVKMTNKKKSFITL